MTEFDVQGIGMTSRRTRERLIQRLREQGISDMRVLDVMLDTPRHLFLDEALAHRAYEDTALPIGFNQTISQPYIVARMTEVLLAAGPLEKVLEVGTGSGYQTAVLARLVGQVHSVERIRPLQEKAKDRFKKLKLYNIICRHSDGTMGWPDNKMQFDGILVTAAPEQVPDELLQQLAPGGRLVIPVGRDQQQLKLITRLESGGFETQVLEFVRFVPLLSGTIR